jgi:threonylcarbamoyladenosine tRNA methylthiotransferase MtaB
VPELLTRPAVAFHTLGCKLNFSETSTLSRMLQSQGFEPVAFGEPAQVVVINTCSVTEHADRKCRAVVRQALRRSPQAYVVVVGCYAQLKPAEIAAIPGVDLVLGAAEKFRLPEFLRELTKRERGEYHCGDISEVAQFSPSWSQGDRTRTFLKVQDGCDYNCSFCTIPLARGRSRSQSVAASVEKVLELSADGVREIVLTGINLGDFGLVPGPDGGVPERRESFLDLIRALDEAEADLRFRISSLEPNLLHPEIAEFVAASKRFVPHFHMPLQSGSNRILGLMRRRYRRELYAERVDLIRELMPDAAIGVDLITGFPGESPAEFEASYRFVQELDVDYLHVFPYSERENTLAVSLPDAVEPGERMRRSRMLQGLSAKKRRALHERCAGQTRPVLFELADQGGEMHGFSDNYIKVRAPWQAELAGRVLPVTLGPPDAEGLSSALFPPL